MHICVLFIVLILIAIRQSDQLELNVLRSQNKEVLQINHAYPNLVQIRESPRMYEISDFISQDQCLTLLTAMNDKEDNELIKNEKPRLSIDRFKTAIFLVPGVITASVFVAGFNDLSILLLTLVKFSTFVVLVIAAAMFAVDKLFVDSQRSSRMIQLGGNCKHATNETIEIIEKCKQLFNVPSYECFERPCLTRYKSGQSFKKHQDASVDLIEDGWDKLGGQRLATLIIYVNDVALGGGTYFDYLNYRVQPKAGKALLFFPAFADGALDYRMSHCGEEAVDDKYIIQIWRRQQRVPPPLGL